jgi:hypothetical protein
MRGVAIQLQIIELNYRNSGDCDRLLRNL